MKCLPQNSISSGYNLLLGYLIIFINYTVQNNIKRTIVLLDLVVYFVQLRYFGKILPDCLLVNRFCTDKWHIEIKS